jgi:hypothetical protein
MEGNGRIKMRLLFPLPFVRKVDKSFLLRRRYNGKIGTLYRCGNGQLYGKIEGGKRVDDA